MKCSQILPMILLALGFLLATQAPDKKENLTMEKMARDSHEGMQANFPESNDEKRKGTQEGDDSSRRATASSGIGVKGDDHSSGQKDAHTQDESVVRLTNELGPRVTTSKFGWCLLVATGVSIICMVSLLQCIFISGCSETVIDAVWGKDYKDELIKGCNLVLTFHGEIWEDRNPGRSNNGEFATGLSKNRSKEPVFPSKPKDHERTQSFQKGDLTEFLNVESREGVNEEGFGESFSNVDEGSMFEPIPNQIKEEFSNVVDVPIDPVIHQDEGEAFSEEKVVVAHVPEVKVHKKKKKKKKKKKAEKSSKKKEAKSVPRVTNTSFGSPEDSVLTPDTNKRKFFGAIGEERENDQYSQGFQGTSVQRNNVNRGFLMGLPISPVFNEDLENGPPPPYVPPTAPTNGSGGGFSLFSFNIFDFGRKERRENVHQGQGPPPPRHMEHYDHIPDRYHGPDPEFGMDNQIQRGYVDSEGMRPQQPLPPDYREEESPPPHPDNEQFYRYEFVPSSEPLIITTKNMRSPEEEIENRGNNNYPVYPRRKFVEEEEEEEEEIEERKKRTMKGMPYFFSTQVDEEEADSEKVDRRGDRGFERIQDLIAGRRCVSSGPRRNEDEIFEEKMFSDFNERRNEKEVGGGKDMYFDDRSGIIPRRSASASPFFGGEYENNRGGGEGYGGYGRGPPEPPMNHNEGKKITLESLFGEDKPRRGPKRYYTNQNYSSGSGYQGGGGGGGGGRNENGGIHIRDGKFYTEGHARRKEGNRFGVIGEGKREKKINKRNKDDTLAKLFEEGEGRSLNIGSGQTTAYYTYDYEGNNEEEQQQQQQQQRQFGSSRNGGGGGVRGSMSMNGGKRNFPKLPSVGNAGNTNATGVNQSKSSFRVLSRKSHQ